MKRSLETASGSRALVVLPEVRPLTPQEADLAYRSAHETRPSRRLLLAVWLTRGALLAGAIWLVASSLPSGFLVNASRTAKADFQDRTSPVNSGWIKETSGSIPAWHSGRAWAPDANPTRSAPGTEPDGEAAFASAGAGAGAGAGGTPPEVPLPSRKRAADNPAATKSVDVLSRDPDLSRKPRRPAVPLSPMIPARSPVRREVVGAVPEPSRAPRIDEPVYQDASHAGAESANAVAPPVAAKRTPAAKRGSFIRKRVQQKSSPRARPRRQAQRRVARPRLHRVRQFNRGISRGLRRTGRALRRSVARVFSR